MELEKVECGVDNKRTRALCNPSSALVPLWLTSYVP